MNDDRDPMLQELFASAEQDLDAETFVDGVSRQTGRLKQRRLLWRVGLGLVFAICAWLLAASIQDGVGILTDGITKPLIAFDDDLLAAIVLPLNSFANVLALGFLGLWAAYRSLIS